MLLFLYKYIQYLYKNRDKCILTENCPLILVPNITLRLVDRTDSKFTLRNFLLRKKPLSLSSSSPLRFTRRSEYLTALNRLRCSGSPLKGSPCAPHPNPTQKFSISEVVGCLNFEGKFLLSGLRLIAMLNTIKFPFLRR